MSQSLTTAQQRKLKSLVHRWTVWIDRTTADYWSIEDDFPILGPAYDHFCQELEAYRCAKKHTRHTQIGRRALNVFKGLEQLQRWVERGEELPVDKFPEEFL